MRQQRGIAADRALEPFVAAQREGTVTRQMKIGVDLSDIVELRAGHIRTVERNERCDRSAPTISCDECDK